MSDISSIFGGSFTPPKEPVFDPPEVQARDAMAAVGIDPPDEIIMDGNIRRFSSGKRKDKNAWYVFFGDGIPAGRFGDWREGIEVSFKANTGRTHTAAEEMALSRRMAEAKEQRDKERQRTAEVASDTVSDIWANAGAASSDHPYLKRKGIQAHGARITGDGRLIVPLYSADGELATVQYIDGEGGKKYHPGGATGGKLWCIGTADSDTAYIAEGFATAATIHEVTGSPCYVAYSASNIVPTTEHVRSIHNDVVIVADNDAHGIGQRYAEQASAKHGARIVVPPIPGDANDYAHAGHDLADLLTPKADDWLIAADDFAAQPAPIAWLVKGWLQDEALIMLHGPSGGGKTFVILDMCLRIASGMDDWMGCKVKPGAVVYLAGEGHHGLRGRVAAWKHHNKAGALNMWLSRDGCDLNTAQGYQRVCDSLRSLPDSPRIVVVDTLHRFLLGDENSAQDAKGMLDACNAIMREFSCSVVLVHHTGVSDEAQHRARGSSAWRGALDIEISVVPGKKDAPISIIQRKSKDSEEASPVYGTLEGIAIPGWVDEDGEQVSSAVLAPAEAPPEKEGKESKHSLFCTIMKAAFWSGGAEVREGHPYVSRSGLTEKLRLDDKKDRTIKNMLNPSYDDRLIGYLTACKVIKPYEHGWLIVDSGLSSQLMMAKNG